MEKPYFGEMLFSQRRRLRWAIPFASFSAGWPLMHAIGRFAGGRWSCESLFDWFYLLLMIAWTLILLYLAWSLPRLYGKAAVQLQFWKEFRRANPKLCPWCAHGIPSEPTPICPECGKPYDPPSEVSS
jgi:hypothetical protein